MTCVFLMGNFYVELGLEIATAPHVDIKSVSMEAPAHQLVIHLSVLVLRYVRSLYNICRHVKAILARLLLHKCSKQSSLLISYL